jgi:hypothetical protein
VAELSRVVLLDDVDFSWSDSDLAGLLRHQLQTKLTDDLPGAAAVYPAVTDQGPASFGELLRAEHPPRELLELARLYAKSAAINRHRPLQRDIALVLYFATICAGRVRLGAKLSSKTDRELIEAYRWVLSREWLDPSLVPLFEAGLSATR